MHITVRCFTITHLLLDVMRVLHHGDGLFEIEVGSVRARGKPSQVALRLVHSALSNQPPRRLGGEEGDKEQRHRPGPLKTISHLTLCTVSMVKSALAWTAYGILQPHWSVLVRRPLSMPTAMS